MSAFWASRVVRMAGRRPAGGMGRAGLAAGVLACAVLCATGSAEARRAADRDTSHAQVRVTIDDPRIRVEDRIRDRIRTRVRDRIHDRIVIDQPGATVRIDGQGVTVGAFDDTTDPADDRGIVVVDTDGDDIVRVFADAEVREGERIAGDVVAVFGSVRVAGRVGGNVVAVFGSVQLEPGASVDGDVVAIGGGLDQAAGAQVNGESVSLGFLPFSWGAPTFKAVLGAIAGGWLVALIAGWILVLIFPTRMQRIAGTASRRGGASFVVGVISLPLVLVTIFLMVVTVIGVPFAFVIPFLFILCAWAGHIGATWVLGSRILRRPIEHGHPMGAILAGTLFVAMFFVIGAVLAGPQGASRTFALFFYLLGVLIVAGLTAIGTGSVFLSRFGTRPREAAEGAGPSPSVPAAPAPLAPMGAAPATPPSA